MERQTKRSSDLHKPCIAQLQERVHEWVTTVGVRYFDPMTNMALLTEEVGEVARVMARTYGEQSKKKKDASDLGEELSDVLFVVLCLANQTGTDLQAAFDRKFEKRTKRDKQRHAKNKKLH